MAENLAYNWTKSFDLFHHQVVIKQLELVRANFTPILLRRQHPFQIILARACYYLVDLANPALFIVGRGWRHLEHSDSDNVGVVEAIKRTAIELPGGCEAGFPEPAERSLPKSARNTSFIEWLGGALQQPKDCRDIGYPAAERADSTDLQTVYAPAVIR